MPEIKEKYDKLKYNKKWDAENCKKVTIKMRKADYEIFNKYVTENGLSKNGYIISLIKKDLQEKGFTSINSYALSLIDNDLKSNNN